MVVSAHYKSLLLLLLVPSILGLGSMGNACYSKIKLSSMDVYIKTLKRVV